MKIIFITAKPSYMPDPEELGTWQPMQDEEGHPVDQNRHKDRRLKTGRKLCDLLWCQFRDIDQSIAPFRNCWQVLQR